MLFFAVLMIVAAFFHVKEPQNENKGNWLSKYKITLIILEGIAVGVLTGIVGAGGGFDYSSISIVSQFRNENCSWNFSIDYFYKVIDWFWGYSNYRNRLDLAVFFTSIAVAGIFIGIFLSNYIEGNKLKKVFGIFVLIMGCFILFNELLN